MLSLMQMVPGLTPVLDNGNFEGATYSANGREDQSNLFLVDGVHNKDDRGGAFTQVSMTIDAFSEYNVMTHDYGAEYGGASGVIVNAVTKSGTNLFHGSGYYYGQDDRFNATNYFTKQDGRAKPESGNDIVGREHRRADPPEQGVLLFQHRAAVAPERARPEVSRGGGAPGDVLRGHLRRQPHQVLRAGGLPADPVEQRQFPDDLEPEYGGGRSGR